MKRVVFGQQSWTETPSMIRAEIDNNFPNLQKYYRIGEGKVAHLLHPKKVYQIGIVFLLENIANGYTDECIIYYPAKGMYVHCFCLQPYFPVKRSSIIKTKRGLMQIVQMDNEAVIAFTSGYNKVIE